jgi:hypothetical protein
MTVPEGVRYLPGTRITIDQLVGQRRRYKELRQRWRTEQFRADIRAILAFTTRRAGAVKDDGQEDHLWSLDHSTRRYRVRPVRPGDGAWWVRGLEAVAVFNCQTGDRVAIAVARLEFPISDDDAFGERLFKMRDAYDAEAAQ